MTRPRSQTEQQGRPPSPRGLLLPDVGGEDALLRWTMQVAEWQTKARHPPYAAAVVMNDRIVGLGVNTVDVDFDPAAHAEVNALRDATGRLQRSELGGAVVYSNAEPCGICLTVARAVGVRELVHASQSEPEEPIRDELSVMTVRLRDVIKAALPGFVRLALVDPPAGVAGRT